MIHDGAEQGLREHFEISIRFRTMIEQRIARLESDAARDERALAALENDDHLRRHMKLIAAQRKEADRMRRFLENTCTRIPRQ